MRIIFTPKFDESIDAIIEEFKLDEIDRSTSAASIINGLANDFIIKEIDETGLSQKLKELLSLTEVDSKEVAKEIIDKAVPLLEIVPEDKLDDILFVDDLGKKIWGNENISKTSGVSTPLNVATTINKVIKPLETVNPPNTSSIIKKNGPDEYREPIE